MTTATQVKRKTRAQMWGRKPKRKEFKANQTRQLLKDLERLSNDIVTDPERLAEFVKLWRNGFHRYSWHNTLLIWAQRPDATLCAGYRQWAERYERHVKTGEKGIALLAPIFHKHKVKEVNPETNEETEVEVKDVFAYLFTTVYVWDCAQTEGKELELGGEQLVNGKSRISLDKLIKLFPEYRTEVEGRAITQGSTDGKMRITLHLAKTEAMISTYAHELAHCECGHTSTRYDIPLEQKELEAEAIAYLIGCWLGINDERAKLYIGNWQGDKSKLEKSGKTVLKVAERIIRRIAEAG